MKETDSQTEQGDDGKHEKKTKYQEIRESKTKQEETGEGEREI